MDIQKDSEWTPESTTTLAVKASGMVTAVGFNSPSSCAAIRAGISGIRVGNLWDPGAGENISVGRPLTPQWWEGADMLAELAAPAIRECLDAVFQVHPNTVPIFLLLSPLTQPYRYPNLDEEVTMGLEQRLQYGMPPGSKLLNRGRIGIAHALSEACLLFQHHKASYCIIVGVESFLCQTVAEVYIDRRRLLTKDNSNGFIPGEAACAILVKPAGKKRSREELCISGWGLAHEPGTIDSDKPLTGDGLTQALCTALTQAGIEFFDTHYWLTDQNGEHYKFKEATLARIRLERIRKQPRQQRFEVWHPIEYLGEIGAAIAPCLLGLALAAHTGGYAPGPQALMHVSEDDGERAALVLKWIT